MNELRIGIQVGPHSLFDEGIENSLDLMLKTAGINTLFLYTHSYWAAHGRNKEQLAQDHGVELPSESERNITKVWVNHNEKYFKNTILRHEKQKNELYAERDIFNEIKIPAKDRGIKIYGRILEPAAHEMSIDISNWVKASSINVYGQIDFMPCWNNPNYKMFWYATFEDMLKNYSFDGYQFGSERFGPLSNLLIKGWIPGCFCEHCTNKARVLGVNVINAKNGFKKLYEFSRNMEMGLETPPEGIFMHFMRIIFEYPEILLWDKLYHDSREEVIRNISGIIKTLNPNMEFGIHRGHNSTSWDIFADAADKYYLMSEYCDFIKPVVYHVNPGKKIERDINLMHNKLFKNFSPDTMLKILYNIKGYTETKVPKYDELVDKEMGSHYVYKEVKRCVDEVNGKAKVYPGIGFDLPWKDKHIKSSPDEVYKATISALEAGASGVVASREYDEMRIYNLEAFGKGIKDFRNGVRINE